MPADLSDRPLLAVHYSSVRLKLVNFPGAKVDAILQLCHRD